MSDWREPRLDELIVKLRAIVPDGSFGHGATVDEDLAKLVSVAESAASALSKIAEDARSLLARSIALESSLAVDASRIMYFYFGNEAVEGRDLPTELHMTLSASEAEDMAIDLLRHARQGRRENDEKPYAEQEEPVFGISFNGLGCSLRKKPRAARRSKR